MRDTACPTQKPIAMKRNIKSGTVRQSHASSDVIPSEHRVYIRHGSIRPMFRRLSSRTNVGVLSPNSWRVARPARSVAPTSLATESATANTIVAKATPMDRAAGRAARTAGDGAESEITWQTGQCGRGTRGAGRGSSSERGAR